MRAVSSAYMIAFLRCPVRQLCIVRANLTRGLSRRWAMTTTDDRICARVVAESIRRTNRCRRARPSHLSACYEYREIALPCPYYAWCTCLNTEPAVYEIVYKLTARLSAHPLWFLLGCIALPGIDADYCYRRSGVVCRSVGRSVCHDRGTRKNGRTDRDAVWDVDSGIGLIRKHALDGGAHRRNLANTIEPSVCDGLAAFFQITLTTCFISFSLPPLRTFCRVTVFTAVCLSVSMVVSRITNKKLWVDFQEI